LRLKTEDTIGFASLSAGAAVGVMGVDRLLRVSAISFNGVCQFFQ
jgi:hypothetical protein